MKRLLLLLLLLPQPAFADSVQQGVEKLAKCVTARDVESCRRQITAASQSTYNRFVKHQLMNCLPNQAAYISHTLEKPYALVATHITLSQQEYKTQLIFRKEHGNWKLDLPETLRRGLGEAWEDHLATVEQLYVMLKSQLGDKLNCDAIRGLGGQLTATQ